MSPRYPSELPCEPTAGATSLRSRRRPDFVKFDSLQDLLEEAGYKDTRVFTPAGQKLQHMGPSKIPQGPDQMLPTRLDEQHDDTNISQSCQEPTTEGIVQRFQSIAASSSWFRNAWHPLPSQGDGPESAKARLLRKKKSAPAIRAKAVERRAENLITLPQKEVIHVDTPNQDSAHSASEMQRQPPPNPDPPVTTLTKEDTPELSRKPTLRGAPSTQNLWQGSLRYRSLIRTDKNGNVMPLPKSRSFPSRLRLEQDSKALAEKEEAIDGARVVTGVGVRCNSSDDQGAIKTLLFGIGGAGQSAQSFGKPKQRPSLGNVYDTEQRAQSHPTEQGVSDSSGSLNRNVSGETSEVSPVLLKDSGMESLLYSQAAQPVLSCNDAVVLRNGACLEQVGKGINRRYETEGARLADEESTSKARTKVPQPTRELRKMKSIDALELALAKIDGEKGQHHGQKMAGKAFKWNWSATSTANSMVEPREKHRHALKGKCQTESASHSTTHEPVVATFSDSVGCQEQGPTLSAQEGDIEATRSTTPTLFLTSPTASRSPVPLSLEGDEFEPRSFSSPEVSPQRGRMGGRIPRMRHGQVELGNKSNRSIAQVLRPTPSSDSISSSSSDSANSDRPPLRRKARLSRGRDGSGKDVTATSQAADPHRQASSNNNKKGTSRERRSSSSETQSNQQIGTSIGRTSGTEQIRALRRDVLKREKCRTDFRNTGMEDVFYKAMHSAEKKETRNEGQKQSHVGSDMDRERSSSPPHWNHYTKSPFGDITVAINAVEGKKKRDEKCKAQFRETRPALVNRTSGSVLQKKTSGVGMACLFDEHEAIAKRSGASSPFRDENEMPDSVFDSPTFMIKGQRRGPRDSSSEGNNRRTLPRA